MRSIIKAMRRHQRKVLVILRAGDDTLHRQWFHNQSLEERRWDLHLSYFGNHPDPFPDRPGDVSLSFEKGMKMEGIIECIDKLERRLDQYDYIWLPDDDLSCDLPTLNRFFQLVISNAFLLAQPALGKGSFYAHDITRQRPRLSFRYTSFVEIMCPCFSKESFSLCKPYFTATASHWGIDLMFPKLLGYPRNAIAIVDEAPVVHTRPLTHSVNTMLALSRGKNPKTETLKFLRANGFELHDDWPYEELQVTYAAIDLRGNIIDDPDLIEIEPCAPTQGVW